MVLSSINQTQSQSVTTFGSFSGASSTDVTSVISNYKPQNKSTIMVKTTPLLIKKGGNGKSDIKSTNRTKTSPLTETSSPFRISFATLGTPEFDHASKISVLNPSYDQDSSDSQFRSANTSNPTLFKKRLAFNFKPEEPLPPIFSIFD